MWQSFLVQATILLILYFYAFAIGWPAYEYVVQVLDIVLVCYLLWRVETLSELIIPESTTKNVEDSDLSLSMRNKIGPLLKLHCEEPQLYLQHNLTLLQLAKAVGTNRFYLSQYFSSQGTTYNAYINDLRINHFVSLYREAIAAHRSFTAQQLANECGYRSYSTFTLAFKQRMGQNITTWMRKSAE